MSAMQAPLAGAPGIASVASAAGALATAPGVVSTWGAAPWREYRYQQIMGSRPEALVLLAYEATIQACRSRDGRRASQGLVTLIDGLNLDAGEIGLGLLRLYDYALRCVKTGRFDAALEVLEPLRQTWAKALYGQACTADTAGAGGDGSRGSANGGVDGVG